MYVHANCNHFEVVTARSHPPSSLMPDYADLRLIICSQNDGFSSECSLRVCHHRLIDINGEPIM